MARKNFRNIYFPLFKCPNDLSTRCVENKICVIKVYKKGFLSSLLCIQKSAPCHSMVSFSQLPQNTTA